MEKMTLVPDSHKDIAEICLPTIINMAKTINDMVEPDEGTCQIMKNCFGSGFSLGVAYGQTNPDAPPRERVKKAFELIAEGKL